jgi:hypothetical protein
VAGHALRVFKPGCDRRRPLAPPPPPISRPPALVLPHPAAGEHAVKDRVDRAHCALRAVLLGYRREQRRGAAVRRGDGLQMGFQVPHPGRGRAGAAAAGPLPAAAAAAAAAATAGGARRLDAPVPGGEWVGAPGEGAAVERRRGARRVEFHPEPLRALERAAAPADRARPVHACCCLSIKLGEAPGLRGAAGRKRAAAAAAALRCAAREPRIVVLPGPDGEACNSRD